MNIYIYVYIYIYINVCVHVHICGQSKPKHHKHQTWSSIQTGDGINFASGTWVCARVRRCDLDMRVLQYTPPPAPPHLNVDQDCVSSLAKFIPVERPPWTYKANNNIESGGWRGGTEQEKLQNQCPSFTCEINSVNSHLTDHSLCRCCLFACYAHAPLICLCALHVSCC